MSLSILRMLARISVRTRIVILAVLPVIGILINSIAFMASDAEVEQAFQTVEHASELADVSREFSGALAAMRVRAHDFAVRPSQDLVASFEAAHATAARTLAIIENSVNVTTRKSLATLKRQIDEVATEFAELVHNQKRLGFTESDGTRSQMTKTVITVERIIQEDLSWMKEADAQKFLVSLLTMRRYETEYRLTRSNLMQVLFFEEFKNFNKHLETVAAAEIMKEQIAQKVKAYSDTFVEWIEIV